MSDDAKRSPLVHRHGWGQIEVEGVGSIRDAKLWPGGGRAWDWTETGTDHQPGVQPADLAELLEHEPDVIILSRGRQGRLGVSPETLSLLAERGIEIVGEETAAAIEHYNRLAAAGRRVAALIHTTC